MKGLDETGPSSLKLRRDRLDAGFSGERPDDTDGCTLIVTDERYVH